MFSAHRPGSGTGGVGPESSPISHLSETMRALLDASPAQAAHAAYFSHSEREGVGGGGLGAQEKPRRTWDVLGLGQAGVAASLALSSLLPSPPSYKSFLIFGNLKTQINNTNSSPLTKENFLLQNKELGACWRMNSVIGRVKRGSGKPGA